MSSHYAKGSKAPPILPDRVRFYNMAFCPFGQRLRFLLDYHKFSYDQIFINTANKPEWLFEDFPEGSIPSIIIKGEKMVDSEFITPYLDKVRDTNISPRSLMEISGQKTIDDLKAWWEKVYKSFFETAFNLTVSDEQKKTYFDAMKEFENFIKGDPFISGPEVGYADFYVYPMIDRMEPFYRIVGKEMPKEEDWPVGYKWLKAMRELDVVKRHHISAQRHYDYALTARANAKNYDI